MLLFENARRSRNIDRVLGDFVPWQADEPIEVIAQDRVFSDGRRNLLQMLEFLECDFLHLLRQPVLLNLLPNRVRLGNRRIGLAQLQLDRPHLLAQEIVALALGHRAGDLVLDLRTQGEHFQFAVHQRSQAL